MISVFFRHNDCFQARRLTGRYKSIGPVLFATVIFIYLVKDISPEWIRSNKMYYDAPAYRPAVAPTAATTSTLKIALVIVGCLFVGFLIACGAALALGLGLGLGLPGKDVSGCGRRCNTATTSVPTATASTASVASTVSTGTTSFSPLSAPIVNCTFTGSSTCGCSAVQPSFRSSRIVQGYTAVTSSWPWIVALVTNNGNSLCSGFLISDRHVVTAAHCLNASLPPTSIQVYGGIQSLSTRDNGQLRGVASFIIHPSYSISPTIINDIAVMTLTVPFNTTSSAIGTCCLPTDTSVPSLNDVGVIAGWGVTSSTSTTPSDVLLQGLVKVLNESVCVSSSFGSIRFCAAYGGTDACFGDSGGPYMIGSNNSWSCVGVVSLGNANSNSCGQGSLYTRVSAFRQFIRDNTGI